eukprot:COSAG06_NODE_381_length_16594_cov_7.199454_3_plen_2083_part_00
MTEVVTACRDGEGNVDPAFSTEAACQSQGMNFESCDAGYCRDPSCSGCEAVQGPATCSAAVCLSNGWVWTSSRQRGYCRDGSGDVYGDATDESECAMLGEEANGDSSSLTWEDCDAGQCSGPESCSAASCIQSGYQWVGPRSLIVQNEEEDFAGWDCSHVAAFSSSTTSATPSPPPPPPLPPKPTAPPPPTPSPSPADWADDQPNLGDLCRLHMTAIATACRDGEGNVDPAFSTEAACQSQGMNFESCDAGYCRDPSCSGCEAVQGPATCSAAVCLSNGWVWTSSRQRGYCRDGSGDVYGDATDESECAMLGEEANGYSSSLTWEDCDAGQCSGPESCSAASCIQSGYQWVGPRSLIVQNEEEDFAGWDCSHVAAFSSSTTSATPSPPPPPPLPPKPTAPPPPTPSPSPAWADEACASFDLQFLVARNNSTSCTDIADIIAATVVDEGTCCVSCGASMLCDAAIGCAMSAVRMLTEPVCRTSAEAVALASDHVPCSPACAQGWSMARANFCASDDNSDAQSVISAMFEAAAPGLTDACAITLSGTGADSQTVGHKMVSVSGLQYWTEANGDYMQQQNIDCTHIANAGNAESGIFAHYATADGKWHLYWTSTTLVGDPRGGAYIISPTRDYCDLLVFQSAVAFLPQPMPSEAPPSGTAVWQELYNPSKTPSDAAEPLDLPFYTDSYYQTPSTRWDSGTLTNANGNAFSLFLLPAQPPGTFTLDRDGHYSRSGGGRLYKELCQSVGLRTVTVTAINGNAPGNCCAYCYNDDFPGHDDCLSLPTVANGTEQCYTDCLDGAMRNYPSGMTNSISDCERYAHDSRQPCCLRACSPQGAVWDDGRDIGGQFFFFDANKWVYYFTGWDDIVTHDWEGGDITVHHNRANEWTAFQDASVHPVCALEHGGVGTTEVTPPIDAHTGQDTIVRDYCSSNDGGSSNQCVAVETVLAISVQFSDEQCVALGEQLLSVSGPCWQAQDSRCTVACAEALLNLDDHCDSNLPTTVEAIRNLLPGCTTTAATAVSTAQPTVLVSGLQYIRPTEWRGNVPASHSGANALYNLQPRPRNGRPHYMAEGGGWHIYWAPAVPGANAAPMWVIDNVHPLDDVDYVKELDIDAFLASSAETVPTGTAVWREWCYAETRARSFREYTNVHLQIAEAQMEVPDVLHQSTVVHTGQAYDFTFPAVSGTRYEVKLRASQGSGTSAPCPQDANIYDRHEGCTMRFTTLPGSDSAMYDPWYNPPGTVFFDTCDSLISRSVDQHNGIPISCANDFCSSCEYRHYCDGACGFECEETWLSETTLFILPPRAESATTQAVAAVEGMGPDKAVSFTAANTGDFNARVVATGGSGLATVSVASIGSVLDRAPHVRTDGSSDTISLHCHLQSCTYSHNGAPSYDTDGSSFDMILPDAHAGVSYAMTVALPQGQTGTQIKITFYQANAVAGAAGFAPVLSSPLGQWSSTADDSQDFAQYYGCSFDDRWCIPQMRDDFGVHSGGRFETFVTGTWVSPTSGPVVMRLVANCDIPFYADVALPGCHPLAFGGCTAGGSVNDPCDPISGFARVTQCSSEVVLTITPGSYFPDRSQDEQGDIGRRLQTGDIDDHSVNHAPEPVQGTVHRLDSIRVDRSKLNMRASAMLGTADTGRRMMQTGDLGTLHEDVHAPVPVQSVVRRVDSITVERDNLEHLAAEELSANPAEYPGLYSAPTIDEMLVNGTVSHALLMSLLTVKQQPHVVYPLTVQLGDENADTVGQGHRRLQQGGDTLHVTVETHAPSLASANRAEQSLLARLPAATRVGGRRRVQLSGDSLHHHADEIHVCGLGFTHTGCTAAGQWTQQMRLEIPRTDVETIMTEQSDAGLTVEDMLVGGSKANAQLARALTDAQAPLVIQPVGINTTSHRKLQHGGDYLAVTIETHAPTPGIASAGIGRLINRLQAPSASDLASHSPVGDACAPDLATRSAAVTQECCNEPHEDCSGGFPASCNAGCAVLLLPFFSDCSSLLGVHAVEFAATVEMCQATLEGVPSDACDLSTRTIAVNSECCDEPSEDCSSGTPSSCNVGCAAVVLPFFADCSAALGKGASNFEAFTAMCRATLHG